MKRFTLLGLTIFLLLTSINFTFASSLFSDIEDENIKNAVERLAALGIVNGLGDGKYHPEKEVTREQFVTIMVRALGLESASDTTSENSNKFSDVDTDSWSSKYIHIATDKGIIKGMEDGTFAPTAPVKYSEALTVLVRSLGYKDVFLQGSWPENFLKKAAELNITNNIEFDESAKVNRGSIALLVNNTLNCEILKVEESSEDSIAIYYPESDSNLLKNNLGITMYDKVTMTLLKSRDFPWAGEVNIQFSKDTQDGKYKQDDVKIFKTKENLNFDFENLPKEKLNIYINEDNIIIHIEKQN